MARRTVTRAHLAGRIYEELGLSRRGSARLVDEVFEEMSRVFADGGSVKISKFGTFGLRRKGARVGRNPKTGVEAEITARTVLTFRASRSLKRHVDEGHAPGPLFADREEETQTPG